SPGSHAHCELAGRPVSHLRHRWVGGHRAVPRACERFQYVERLLRLGRRDFLRSFVHVRLRKSQGGEGHQTKGQDKAKRLRGSFSFKFRFKLSLESAYLLGVLNRHGSAQAAVLLYITITLCRLSSLFCSFLANGLLA